MRVSTKDQRCRNMGQRAAVASTPPVATATWGATLCRVDEGVLLWVLKGGHGPRRWASLTGAPPHH